MRRKDILGQYPWLRNKGMVVGGCSYESWVGRKGDAVSGRGKCKATK